MLIAVSQDPDLTGIPVVEFAIFGRQAAWPSATLHQPAGNQPVPGLGPAQATSLLMPAVAGCLACQGLARLFSDLPASGSRSRYARFA
jgi:hypothetical protein